MPNDIRKGLEGVIAAESELSYVDGDAGQLIYRGYDIEDVAHDASFEEVLHLLWYGHLPNEDELTSFETKMTSERMVDEGVLSIVRELAEQDEDPMAALRTAVSTLSAYDPDDSETSNHEIDLQKGRQLTAKMPTILAAYDRFRTGREPVTPREDLGHAANFLYMLNGEEPDEVLTETFDMALVLHADHGLNASTFSAVVTASTQADIYAAATSAIGTLSGSLHGGANQNVMRLLQEIDGATEDPVAWIEKALNEGRRIPGFGHRVYDVKDPRAKILGGKSEEISHTTGDVKWYEMSVAIEEYMAEEKGIVPNVDFYSASMYYQMGIPIDLYTPIFALSRIGGWIAHVNEYRDDNRLIRPRARYVGPENEEFRPVDAR